VLGVGMEQHTAQKPPESAWTLRQQRRCSVSEGDAFYLYRHDASSHCIELASVGAF
jgi:hypothetical protein